MSSSREKLDDAGWKLDEGEPSYKAMLDRRLDPRPISWLRPAPLLESANQIIDQTLSDIVSPRRQRWVADQRRAGVNDLTIRGVVSAETRSSFKFLLIGDTGEGDASQYAVVPALVSRGRDTEFMVIVSDVIYPAGDINGYVNGFHIPYAEYDKPIYALPGNHDWLDGLNGFMFHFCGAEPLPAVSYASSGLGLSGRMARLLWRRGSRPQRALLADYRSRKAPPAVAQPGPYWSMEAGPLIVVAIDTGVDGSIDREQAEWLFKVSKEDAPKILLTGKPLVVNLEHKPGTVQYEANPNDKKPPQFKTIDDVVRCKDHRYIAAIGGDIHNYQRYRIRVPECGRDLTYIVSGGGGAFLSSTHTLGSADAVAGSTAFSERDFRCYPLRGDSLLHFTKLVLKHGGSLAVAVVLVIFALVAACLILLHATDAATYLDWLPSRFPITESWDLAELGALLALVAGVGFAVPPLVLQDKWRGVQNGGKLAAVATALFVLAQSDLDPTPWVVGGAIAIPLAHAIMWPRRQLFTMLLAVAGALTALVWVLRDSDQVYEHSGHVAALALAPLLLYMFRRRHILVCLVVLGVGAALWFVGLDKALIAIPAVAAAFLFGFLVLSRLVVFPFLSIAQWLARLPGISRYKWADAPTADAAARWLAKHRLGNMTPTRTDAATAAEPSSLWRLSFRLLCATTKFGRLAQSKFSELFDANEAPFFRSFLEVEVRETTVKISCFAATGLSEHESDPPCEDYVTLDFEGNVVDELGARTVGSRAASTVHDGVAS